MIFRLLVISIHALREEGDQCTFLNRRERQHFYPRPPRGGRPFASMRCAFRASNFYPRPPRGGRHADFLLNTRVLRISIHALREEGDKLALGAADVSDKFLSTPSARRATTPCVITGRSFLISIHALREEGDSFTHGSASFRIVISIHALREEGDDNNRYVIYSSKISIHALREEGDLSPAPKINARTIFLSTPSARRATPTIQRTGCVAPISIHALREEGDACASV